MRCPLCLDEELTVHIRDGIEVDRCPRCRGIWLDRGELDKLLDLAEARSPETQISPPPRSRPEPLPRDRHDDRYEDRDRHRDDDRRRDDRYRDDDRDDRDRPRKKRKSAFAELLGEVLDF